MNINQNINKLLYALSIKGKLYKITSFRTYNEDKHKYRTSYKVFKKQLVEEYNIETDEFEKVEKYLLDTDCYNKIDLMKYLVRENGKEGEADERRS